MLHRFATTTYQYDERHIGLTAVFMVLLPTRWTNDLVRAVEVQKILEAQDHSMWRRLGKAYDQQWISIG